MAATPEKAEDKVVEEGAGNPADNNALLMSRAAFFRDRHREWYCRKEYDGEEGSA